MTTEPPAAERPLRRDARENQERLLSAATVAVLRDGPRVPMGTVAAEAGVGVGTLYRHYPTRDALLDALTRRLFGIVLSCAHHAEQATSAGLRCLDDFLDAVIEHRNELVLPLHGGPSVATAATRAVRAQVHQALQRLIDRGQADGSVRADATTADVIIFGAMIAQPTTDRLSGDATSRRLKQVYLDGLAGAR